MQTVNAHPGNSRTFLIHMFGRGLEDDRYVVERFKSLTNGDIRPLNAEKSATKGRHKAPRTTVSLKSVREMRPKRDEIIICTGVTIKAAHKSGVISQHHFSWNASNAEVRFPEGVPPASRRAGVLHLDFNPAMESDDGLPGSRNRAST